jgi:uncharacterized protein YbcI
MTNLRAGAEGPQDPGDPDERRRPPSDMEVKAEISRELLRIHEESYGEEAGRPQTYLGEDFVIVILDDPKLLPNEKLLVESGHQDTVALVKTQYLEAIQASFRAAIERATGRRVTGFACTASVAEPRFVAEVFRLG